MPNPTPTATWQSLRMLALTLVAAPVVILVALWTVLGSQDHAFEPPLWALLAPVAAAAVAALLVSAIGYRTDPLDPALPADDLRSSAASRFQSLMLLRFTLAEAVVIVAVVLAFVVPQGGVAVLLTGVVLGEVLLWWHVVPNATHLQKVQAALDARGATVSLRDVLQAP